MRMAPLLSPGNKSSTQINERTSAYNSMINIWSCLYWMVIYALDFYSFTLQKKIAFAFHSVWHSCVATLFCLRRFFSSFISIPCSTMRISTAAFLYSIRWEHPGVIVIVDVALPFISFANFFSFGYSFFFSSCYWLKFPFLLWTFRSQLYVCFLDCSTAFFVTHIRRLTCIAAYLQYICICIAWKFASVISKL